jgi:hypothetical protein
LNDFRYESSNHNEVIMAYPHLATYLNDHLAGSVMAIKLLVQLEEASAGTAVAPTVTALRTEIEAEQQELEQLMARMEISQQVTRQATAWMTEKITQLKLHLDDSTDGLLRQFEMLEGVAIGIQGKQALWRSLAATANFIPALQGVDYAHLIARGEDQHRRAEALRLEAAQMALIVQS